MFERLGDQWGLALARQIRSEWLALSGRLDEAFVMTELSSEGMRNITSSVDAMQQRGLALSILIRQGRVDEAEQRVREILDSAEADGGARVLVQSSILAAQVSLARREFDDARAHVERAERLAPEWVGMPPQLSSGIELARASVLLGEGHPDAALTALHAAAEPALASGDNPIMAQVALGFGEHALHIGDVDRAYRALELAVSLRGVLEALDPRVAGILKAVGTERERELARASAPLDRGPNGAETALRELLG